MIRTVTIAAAAAMLGLAGCDTNSPPPPQVHVLGLTNLSPPDCSTSSFAWVKTLRVMVASPPLAPGVYQPGQYPRRVYVANPAGQSEASERAKDSSPGVQKNTYSESGNYPYHIDLTTLGIRSGEVMVRVILPTGGAYDFDTDTLKSGIGIADPNNTDVCIINNNVQPAGSGTGRVAVFFVKYAGGGSRSTTEPYSMVLKVQGTDQTPFIVDPKIKNPGG